MPKLSALSIERLNTCYPMLIEFVNGIIRYVDVIVICGFRNEQEQNEAYAKGFSKLKWPYGRHNKTPSLAVDVAPYPLNWNDVERFKQVGFFMMGYAAAKDYQIRWGADWNKNYLISDERFIDLPHFEVIT